MRTELGRDAVILHTRTVRRGGFLGIGARPVVEITATLDQRITALCPAPNRARQEAALAPNRARQEAASAPNRAHPEAAPDPSRARKEAAPDPSRARKEAASGHCLSRQQDRQSSPRPLPPPAAWPAQVVAGAVLDSSPPPAASPPPHPFTLIKDVSPAASATPSPPASLPPSGAPSPQSATDSDTLQALAAPIPASPPSAGSAERPSDEAAPERVRVLVNSDPGLRTEVTEIRTMVRDLLQQAEQVRRPQAPAELLDYYTQLVGQDVARELAAQLLERVAARMHQSGPAGYWDEHGRPISTHAVPPGWVRQELERQVAELVPPAAPLELSAQGRPTTVAMVGPTGVGKTTTIAKLAANMKLREGRKVGLITIDTYRIAAVEQLRTYAEILQVPLVAVTTPEELREAVRRLADLDLILIDTAGRSQKDELRIAELRRFLDAVQPDQVHLVLSSTSCEEAIREAIRNFSVLGAQHVVFTKLDEAVGFGVILNVLRSVNLRLSYLTNGQSVPADIEVGSAQRVARLILGEQPDPNRDHEGAAAPAAPNRDQSDPSRGRQPDPSRGRQPDPSRGRKPSEEVRQTATPSQHGPALAGQGPDLVTEAIS